MFLLLDVDQITDRTKNLNNGLPVPAVKWEIGDENPVVVPGIFTLSGICCSLCHLPIIVYVYMSLVVIALFYF